MLELGHGGSAREVEEAELANEGMQLTFGNGTVRYKDLRGHLILRCSEGEPAGGRSEVLLVEGEAACLVDLSTDILVVVLGEVLILTASVVEQRSKRTISAYAFL